MKAALSLLVCTIVVCQTGVAVQTGQGAIEGYVADADGGVLPGVTVEVTSASLTAPMSVTSNARGRFDITSLPADEYRLALSLPGFRTTRGVVGVRAGARSPVTFQMGVGSLTETLTVRSAVPAPAVQPSPSPMTGPIRVGGSIREPRKIGHVNPVFPPGADAAGAQGVVIIEAIIGADGSVTSARVLQGVPLLNTAALEAVRSWRYTPTLLNGRPVEVLSTVTVNFVR